MYLTTHVLPTVFTYFKVFRPSSCHQAHLINIQYVRSFYDISLTLILYIQISYFEFSNFPNKLF